MDHLIQMLMIKNAQLICMMISKGMYMAYNFMSLSTQKIMKSWKKQMMIHISQIRNLKMLNRVCESFGKQKGNMAPKLIMEMKMIVTGKIKKNNILK